MEARGLTPHPDTLGLVIVSGIFPMYMLTLREKLEGKMLL